MHTLNLGILAHVDAGKTSLTERLLLRRRRHRRARQRRRRQHPDRHARAGAPARHHHPLRRRLVRRRRLTVNLIDTPGHPDFIAEVERVLARARRRRAGPLGRRGRPGADPGADARAAPARAAHAALRQQDRPPRRADRGRCCREIADRLTPAVVPMNAVRDARHPGRGGRTRTALPTALLEAAGRARRRAAGRRTSTDGRPSRPRRLRGVLAAQTRRALVHPVFFGSAITGAGVDRADRRLRELLPAAGRRRRRPAVRHGVQGRARPGGREDRATCGCSPGRCACATG